MINKKNIILISLAFSISSAYAHCNLKADYQISKDFYQHLYEICNSLIAQGTPQLYIELILTDQIKFPNAYAFIYKKQRIILISKPLILANKSDPRSLAFVIGHELGHHQFDLADSSSIFTRILNKAKIGAMSVINADFSKTSVLTKYALLGEGKKYDRVRELDADMYSLKLIEGIGLTKADAIRSLQVVELNTSNPIWTKFLNDHPNTKIRINSLK
jgi:Zn-dependent protease with chaperone function